MHHLFIGRSIMPSALSFCKRKTLPLHFLTSYNDQFSANVVHDWLWLLIHSCFFFLKSGRRERRIYFGVVKRQWEDAQSQVWDFSTVVSRDGDCMSIVGATLGRNYTFQSQCANCNFPFAAHLRQGLQQPMSKASLMPSPHPNHSCSEVDLLSRFPFILSNAQSSHVPLQLFPLNAALLVCRWYSLCAIYKQIAAKMLCVVKWRISLDSVSDRQSRL